MKTTRGKKPACIIFGGAGFLGRHLVDALVDSHHVTTFDVREIGDPNVQAVIGDIRESQQVQEACKGMDAVFHCAAIAQGSADATMQKLAYAVNVVGTQNVIQACHACRVPKLIYTSTASVVYDGRDLHNVDESAAYATRTLDCYTETKIQAEKLVLAANGVQGLATVVIRPSGIFGEWDRLMVPLLVEKARQGKTKYIIGNGRNLMEFTYVGNVADALVLAAEKLSSASAVAGRAYFITNDEPRLFWGFLGDILEPLNYSRPHIRLPWVPLFLLALFLEWVVGPLLRPIFKLQLTDFSSNRIRLASANRTISCERAKRELGYQPRVSIAEGLRRTVAHYQPLTRGHEYKKVH